MNEPPVTGRNEATRLVGFALLGLVASAAFLWLAVLKLDLDEIGRALASAQAWPWIPAAMLAYLGGHVVRGLRCKKLVERDADLHLATATNVVVLGYGVNNALPARLGELARAALLSERIGMPLAQSLTVTLLERVLDGWTILLLLAAGAAFAPELDGVALPGVGTAAVVFGVASVAIAWMLLFPYRSAGIAARVAGAVRDSWREPVWRFFVSVSNGLAYLRQPGQALTVTALSIVVWLLEALTYLLVLPAFGLAPSFEAAFLAMALANVGILVPSVRGQVGAFHALCTQALVMLGVAGGTAAAFAVTVHAVFYVPITLWGLAVVLRYGGELVWARARGGGRGAPGATGATGASADPRLAEALGDARVAWLGVSRDVPRASAPSRLVASITEALLADRGGSAGAPGAPVAPSAPGAPGADVTRRVAEFVQGQVNALPAKLRLLFAVGMAGFQVLVLLRYGRAFAALSLETRRAVVSAWAYGPYAPARQLFRLLRSTALLAYFEDVARPGARSGARPETRPAGGPS